MGNFKSQYATDNRVESIIHITNMIVRAGMQINKDKGSDTDYFVMSGNTVETIINAYQNKNAKSALVIDDLGLQVINRLKQEGVTDITLCLTRIPDKMFALTKARIKKTFKDFNINIISLEELTYMNVDLVIANPPYGKNGANITKKITDTVDFTEYVNLLPANDYKRNDSKDLFNYQSDMESIKDGFADAAVITHLAKIHKTKVNNMTLDEFTISQCIDSQLKKYFRVNISRTQKLDYKDLSGKRPDKWLLNRTLLVGWRDGANRHMPYTKDVKTYHWNVLEDLDVVDFIEPKNRTRAKAAGTFELCYFAYTFKTSIEKTNIAQFMYSDLGFKFIAKAFTAENSDGNKEIFIDLALPKVDWTRSWTVEEILANYGYTEEEIKEVMKDLTSVKDDGTPKYKGMDD